MATFFINLIKDPPDKVMAEVEAESMRTIPSDKAIFNRSIIDMQGDKQTILEDEIYLILEVKKNIQTARVNIMAIKDSQASGTGGHTDIPHLDSHVDSHVDDHTDGAHTDHSDNTHSNVAFDDVAFDDVAHEDFTHEDFTDTHVDTFDDFHGDHQDDVWHFDEPHEDEHFDVPHANSFSDIHANEAHVDEAHVDEPHEDETFTDHGDGHADDFDDIHGDEHEDTPHTDSET